MGSRLAGRRHGGARILEGRGSYAQTAPASLALGRLGQSERAADRDVHSFPLCLGLAAMVPGSCAELRPCRSCRPPPACKPHAAPCLPPVLGRSLAFTGQPWPGPAVCTLAHNINPNCPLHSSPPPASSTATSTPPARQSQSKLLARDSLYPIQLLPQHLLSPRALTPPLSKMKSFALFAVVAGVAAAQSLGPCAVCPTAPATFHWRLFTNNANAPAATLRRLHGPDCQLGVQLRLW